MDSPAPPPYTAAVEKLSEFNQDLNPPPIYTDINGQSVTYINNYPGPPLTDGCIDMVSEVRSSSPENIMPKKTRIYLLINGLLTIFFSLAAVGLQIGILTLHSIIYYYYGFWAGAFLICMGVNTIFMYRHHSRKTYSNLFHAFFWQMILIGVVLGIGVIIILTDKCNDNNTDSASPSRDPSCEVSYKALNGFLIGIFALAFLQSVFNTLVFGTLKRRSPDILSFLS
ncbi:unnamed protein product [Adineta ricciae]|uniref:Uncharacterized protein n=1 Tax=Adineta ricciae TaxID=249248 RepID=A0A815INK3_ADIRI|nr:unnamed protein product [Adineta ricciae]CAF1368384.1 unnamed protein product [Adineta ricciae]